MLVAQPLLDASTTYAFSIAGVDDIAKAKEACLVLEPIFDVRPDFDDNTDRFTVSSEAMLSEGKLRDKLASNGYVLADFTIVTSRSAEEE